MSQITAGEVFKLKNLVEYTKGQAVKKPLVNLPGQKVILVAIDKGTLPDHPAPLNAMVIVLEGKGTITYDGKENKVKEGDSILFAKGVVHSVTTEDKLKFILVMSEADF